MNKRVVITGMGCITPVGNDVTTTWKNLLEGVSGIDYAKRFDASTFPSKILGEVKGFEPPNLNGNSRNYTRLGHQLGIAAAHMAIEDSHLNIGNTDPAKIGIAVGGTGDLPILD